MENQIVHYAHMSHRRQLRARQVLRRALDRVGVAVAPVDHARGHDLDAHDHDLLEWALVGSGRVSHRINGRELPGPAGSLLCIPVGSTHTYAVESDGTRVWNLIIDPTRLAIPVLPPALARGRAAVLRPAGSGAALVAGIDALDLLPGLLREQEGGAPGWERALLGRFHLVLLAAVRAALAGRITAIAAPDPRIAALTERIAADPAHPWTLAILARAAGLGVPGLVRAFRRGAGCTPAAFVRRSRVAAARALLVGGSDLESAARAVGYGSASALAHARRRVADG